MLMVWKPGEELYLGGAVSRARREAGKEGEEKGRKGKEREREGTSRKQGDGKEEGKGVLRCR